MDEEEQRKLIRGIIHILKGNVDPDMGFPTVIASAKNADEAVDAFRAGADGVHINGEFIFRDQIEKAE